MTLFKLTAPRSMGKIPQGFTLQVSSAGYGNPSPKEVESALKGAGFTDSSSLSWCSPGNWKVEKMS